MRHKMQNNITKLVDAPVSATQSTGTPVTATQSTNTFNTFSLTKATLDVNMSKKYDLFFEAISEAKLNDEENILSNIEISEEFFKDLPVDNDEEDIDAILDFVLDNKQGQKDNDITEKTNFTNEQASISQEKPRPNLDKAGLHLDNLNKASFVMDKPSPSENNASSCINEAANNNSNLKRFRRKRKRLNSQSFLSYSNAVSVTSYSSFTKQNRKTRKTTM